MSHLTYSFQCLIKNNFLSINLYRVKKRKLKKQEKEHIITSEDKDTISHGIIILYVLACVD